MPGWWLQWGQQVGNLSGEGIYFSWLQLEEKAEKVSPGKEPASWWEFSKLFREWDHPACPHPTPCKQEDLGHVWGGWGRNHHQAARQPALTLTVDQRL